LFLKLRYFVWFLRVHAHTYTLFYIIIAGAASKNSTCTISTPILVNTLTHMQRLDPELLHHILHSMQPQFLTPAHLRLLNNLKPVSRTWAHAVRHILKHHAPARPMLERFREDCEQNYPLKIPLRCRMNPYASSHDLIVLSVLDDFHILDRCVQAVVHDLCIAAQPCESSRTCPCTWHFEEVLGDAHDPALCLATLRIRRIRLEVAGRTYTCLQDALRTEFTPAEIAHATDRGLCSRDSLLLACMHLGHAFASTWLSVGLLRVLRSLQNTQRNSVLQVSTFIDTETQTI
jgi:hypothetical protein